MLIRYEILVVLNRECSEVITFETEYMMNDSNDIITYAVNKGMISEKDRHSVKWAKAILKYKKMKEKKDE